MLLISKAYWLGFPFNFKGEIPEGSDVKPIYVQAMDMRWIHGLFYQAPAAVRQKIGVLVMHPRADFTRHYCIPGLLQAGINVLGLCTRTVGNDATAIHEDLLLDVAQGVKYLKENGCDKVVLFGNSGGGSLFAFYQAQAEKKPEERLQREPSGRPTKLPKAELIPADGFISVSAHPGEGKILGHCIDPAVVDETRPLISNPELDMYNPANGFAEPPNPSSYSPEFVEKYRAAQLARVKRLDDMAYAMLNDAREAEKVWKASEGQMPFAVRQEFGRRASMEPVMVVYRTMANLHYTDPTLDPSKRSYGSLFSERPDLMNYQYIGFGRVVTPAAWLSTWSSLSSEADFCKNAQQMSAPVLLVNALRDKEIYPGDAKSLWDSVASQDSTYLDQDAEHYFEAPFGEKTAPEVDTLMAQGVPWINQRFAG